MIYRVITLGAVVLAISCGADDKPHPGGADPCESPIGGPLGCPADSQLLRDPAIAPTVDAACKKLVGCGILAGDFMGQQGSACQTTEDCSPGECRAIASGELRCFYHLLDYAWCVGRFNGNRTNRCFGEDPFDTQEKDSILACIDRTPCAVLGLPLTDKRKYPPPEADMFICNDGETKVWTVTTCDHGLLQYR